MTEQDPVMAEIGAAAEIGRGTDRAEARRRFDELWAGIGPRGDPLHRCALAHYAADVQDVAEDELVWDRRALEAADELTDERAQAHHGSLVVAGFYPSLHLNLADVHHRLGHLGEARHHLERARAVVGTLAEDGYGRMIRDGIEACGRRIEDSVRSVVDDGAGARQDGRPGVGRDSRRRPAEPPS